MNTLKTFLLLALISIKSSGTSISVAVPSNAIKVGDSFSASVLVTDVADLYAFQFDVAFDRTLLQAYSVVESEYFLTNGAAFSSGVIDNSVGAINLISDTLSGFGSGFTGDTMLATISFTALAVGSTKIVLSNSILVDSALGTIASSTSPAEVAITQDVITPEPSSGLLISLVLASAPVWLLREKRAKRRFPEKKREY